MENILKDTKKAMAETTSATMANYYRFCSQLAFVAVNQFASVCFWSTFRCLDIAEAGLRSLVQKDKIKNV